MNYRAWQLKNADTAGESALLAAGYGPLLPGCWPAAVLPSRRLPPHCWKRNRR